MQEEFTDITALITAWAATEGLGFARNLLVFALILLLGYVASRVVRKTTEAAFAKSRLEPAPLLRQFFVNVAGKSTLVISFIIALGNLGIDTGALIAGLGVSGLVLGFALKDTLSNFASGILILLYRPFDIGHFIEVGSLSGKVKDLTLVSTIMVTPDNKEISIPNSKVWGNALTNFSATGTRRVDLVVGVAYDSDIDEVTAVFESILQEHEKVLEDPAPVVRLRELNASSIDFNVRGWVETADYWDVHAELLREIKNRLDAAGIGIPFPQREVWMHEVPTKPSKKEKASVAEPVV